MHDGDGRSDGELMAATREGDREAFGVLVDRHKDRLVGYLARLTGSAERAEDLGQEAFLRLYQGAATYRDEGRLPALLFSIALNLLRSEERRARRWRLLAPFLPLPPSAAEPGDAAGHGPLLRAEESRQVSAALAALPLRFRVPLVLFEIEGWSYADIAAHLDCRPGTVKSRLHRGRERLKERLAPYWNEGREVCHERSAPQREPATPA